MNTKGSLICRGIRGAVDVPANDAPSIGTATRELLQDVFDANHVRLADIAAIYFTQTADLDADFPARAAREMGLDLVPMLCAREIPVPDSLPRCIRVLVLWNTRLGQEKIRHRYQGKARSLRPDLAEDEVAAW